MDSSREKLNSRGTVRSWISAALQGEEIAAAGLLERYDGLVQSLVQRHLGPARFRDEGEDLVQEIRLSFVRHVGQLRGRDRPSLEAWLRKVVRSRIADWERRRPERIRRLRTSESVSSRGQTPSQEVSRQEEVERLAVAIGAVPRRYRDVLWFLYREDPSPAEVARFLGKEGDAARKFVERALTHLRRVLRIPRRAESRGGPAASA